MNNQLKLGIFVAIGFFAIVVSIVSTGAFTLTKTYHVYAKFDNISGLTRKAKVKIAGVEIGVLRGISLDDSKAKLKLLIRKNIVLYQNASAHIASMGVIGMKYIEIIPGDASFPRLKKGDYISTVQRPFIEDTFNNIVNKIAKALDDDKERGDMIENLAAALCSLKQVLDNLAAQNN
ncbi:MlaD family protein [Candidatus Endomicrobiellum trichonymphae]|uniref:MlaD family protein n=1 Tax=Endomicrobium trichonymphae TaxID=1408204 RepID=UPI000326AD3F|nr:MlaD family protein [Candidatus Endomicrobium trichonymphae]